MAVVVVDVENVRRSRWPNLTPEELVRRARDWAAREGHELRLVFDGEPPAQASDLVGSPYADDAIVALASTLEGPWWLVSSDRELVGRAREHDPERVLGGGSFLRRL